MKPYDAKDIDDCCKLRRDNTDAGDFWLMTDGYEVSIHEQVVGEPLKQAISVPRAEFNRMIRWYMRDQKARQENRK